MMKNGNFTHVYHPNNENLFENASIDIMIFRYCKNKNLEKITNYTEGTYVNNVYCIESNGIITFNDEKLDENKNILSDYFEISVWLVSGKEENYKNKELGNLKNLTNQNKYTNYIFINKYPCNNDNINQNLLNNKEILINRKIRKFNEKNWFEWGAPRNIKKMTKYKGDNCIYILPLTRNKIISFIGKVDYFCGLIMLRPKQKDYDLQKVNDFLNHDNFKKNYIYTGRFKIGHKQLANAFFTI